VGGAQQVSAAREVSFSCNCDEVLQLTAKHERLLPVTTALQAILACQQRDAVPADFHRRPCQQNWLV
jgi:hypothetical protein